MSLVVNLPQTTTNSPLIRGVFSAVVRPINYLKIVYSIICFNSVNMVNMLSAKQLSPNMFFHNKSMFKHLLPTAYTEKNVSLGVHSFAAIPHRVIATGIIPRLICTFRNYTCLDSFIPRLMSFSKCHTKVL